MCVRQHEDGRLCYNQIIICHGSQNNEYFDGTLNILRKWVTKYNCTRDVNKCILGNFQCVFPESSYLWWSSTLAGDSM